MGVAVKERTTHRPAARRALPLALVLLVARCAAPAAHWARPVESGQAAVEPSRAKPAVVVDLDDTVVDGGLLSSLRLVLGFPYSGVAPFEGASEALGQLERDWSIVILTSRASFLEGTTLKWLDGHGFPRAPVAFSSRPILTKNGREEFKRRAIADLKLRGMRVEYGVGDKGTDIRAYLRNGLKAILVLDGPGDPDLGRTLPAGPDLALISFSREGCWPRILRHLRLVSPCASRS